MGNRDEIGCVVERVSESGRPSIELLRPATRSGANLGVFASSFNPPTIAHSGLMRLAAHTFRLDEVLALIAAANADKVSYQCSIVHRIEMMLAAFGEEARVSIGVGSHAFYVDMVEAIESLYPGGTNLHFIMGFDTFERVLDRAGRYIPRYHRRFADAESALEFLLQRSRLIVAGRGDSGREEFGRLLEQQRGDLNDRICFVDFPADLAERSATEVRERIGVRQSIEGLVEPAVRCYIEQNGLYS